MTSISTEIQSWRSAEFPAGESREAAIISKRLREVSRELAYPSVRRDVEISFRFNRLAQKWREETRLLSSVSQITQHRAYREIVEMGTSVLPCILNELQDEPDHWFDALYEITHENPVPPGLRGNITAMAQVWVSWAKRKELL